MMETLPDGASPMDTGVGDLTYNCAGPSIIVELPNEVNVMGRC